MAAKPLTDTYDAAAKVQAKQPVEAIRLYRDIVLDSYPNDADSVKVKRQ